MGELIVLFLWIVNAHLAASVARERKRKYVIWFIISVIFGPLSWVLIAIIIPPENKSFQ